MNITIIDGTFSAKDSIDLITQFIHAKIKYHEAKIQAVLDEEDVKMRENRIKELQKTLFEVRQSLQKQHGVVSLHCQIDVS